MAKKYIDAEKLKAEIERRMLEDYNSDNEEMKYADEVAQGVCASLLFFIDTLSEEPDKSLEKAARLYAIPHYMKDIDVNHIEEYPYDTGLEAAFIAGAKWGAEHIKK